MVCLGPCVRNDPQRSGTLCSALRTTMEGIWGTKLFIGWLLGFFIWRPHLVMLWDHTRCKASITLPSTIALSPCRAKLKQILIPSLGKHFCHSCSIWDSHDFYHIDVYCISARKEPNMRALGSEGKDSQQPHPPCQKTWYNSKHVMTNAPLRAWPISFKPPTHTHIILFFCLFVCF